MKNQYQVYYKYLVWWPIFEPFNTIEDAMRAIQDLKKTCKNIKIVENKNHQIWISRLENRNE